MGFQNIFYREEFKSMRQKRDPKTYPPLFKKIKKHACSVVLRD